ncbi:recombinase [Planosporangium flavigriseum]|uniref:Recombination endonuclease VII n=1 Tax=Planosporangium flavigriseum TaxID=373681 RepID=A0A8J3LVT6_9ACTN|nr:recombinase [Planosporangium flavigriseum]GIG74754.1 hypothetical protein Pfl04_31580 [Planosporangium flavigriseum]
METANRACSSSRRPSGNGSCCKPCYTCVQWLAPRSARQYHLRRRYRIGQKEFGALLAEQGGVCAICGTPDPERVDHDHVFGNVRGILCFNCNGGLGQFSGDVRRLSEAIRYLKGTTWQRVSIHPGVYRLYSPRRELRRSPSS